MINDYYYGTLVEAYKDLDSEAIDGAVYIPKIKFKKTGTSIFRKCVDGIEPIYEDITDGNTYHPYSINTLPFENETYIDLASGLIPVSKFLKYSATPFKERREIFKILHAYDKKRYYNLKLEKANFELKDLNSKVKKLGGTYEKNI